MSVCNLFKQISKESGNFLMFSQYTDDLTKYLVRHNDAKAIPSRFIALNVDYSKLRDITNDSDDLNVLLPTYLQNSYENACAFFKDYESSESNVNNFEFTPEISRNIFWNTFSNLLTFEDWNTQSTGATGPMAPLNTSNNLKFIPEIVYRDNINLQSYTEEDNIGYNEIYCYIPNDAKRKELCVKQQDPLNYVEYPKQYIEGYSSDDVGFTGLLDIEIPSGTQYTYDETVCFWDENKQDLEVKTLDDNSFKFNTVIVLYDIYYNVDNEDYVKYKDIPLGLYITGTINNDGSVTNEITKYVGNSDIYGAGTSYGLRIATRFAATPNATTIKEITVDGGTDYTEFAKVMSSFSESQIKMNDILTTVEQNDLNIKNQLSSFKNYRTNIPYIVNINGTQYWYVNGKNTNATISAAMGPQGVTGPEGPAGRGLPGLQGVTGMQGATGPTGIQGVTGLPGPAGLQGVTGLRGPTGYKGTTGLPGPQGVTGPAGVPGEAGPEGPAGLQGVTGLRGATGLPGPQGIQGVTGLRGPAGGAEGHTYVAETDSLSEGTHTSFPDVSISDLALNEATGIRSHAEGILTTASGDGSHAEGGVIDQDTAVGGGTASGDGSHAEGILTTASGNGSHAEGNSTSAAGDGSHAEGYSTNVTGDNSHAEGVSTVANGDGSHAEGYKSTAIGNYSHAEGGIHTGDTSTSSLDTDGGIAFGDGSHAEGNAISYGIASHAEGYRRTHNSLMGQFSWPTVIDNVEHYEIIQAPYQVYHDLYNWGIQKLKLVQWGGQIRQILEVEKVQVPVEPMGVATLWYVTLNEPFSNDTQRDQEVKVVAAAIGVNSHAEGYDTSAYGNNSHAEGNVTIAVGNSSHTEGYSTVSVGDNSHAEGYSTNASGYISHAEGSDTTAIGEQSHAEGHNTVTVGDSSHTEGTDTISIGDNSHAEGYGLRTDIEAYFNLVADSNIITAQSYDFDLKVGDILFYPNSGHPLTEPVVRRISAIQGLNITVNESFYLDKNGVVLQKITGAVGNHSHVEGKSTIAYGEGAHAEGIGTITSKNGEHAEGKYNVTNNYGDEGLGDVEYVDLSLPSGNLWAKYDLGADGCIDSFTEDGGLFAWGEIEPKETFSWSNYRFGTENNLTKYNSTDNLTVLEPADDAATQILGYNWRTPSREDWNELLTFEDLALSDEYIESQRCIVITNTVTGVQLILPHSMANVMDSTLSSYKTQSYVTQCDARGELLAYAYQDRCLGNYIHPVHSAVLSGAARTQHSIGIGSSDTDRKNAVEVMDNGDVYIKDVGGYDGTNAIQAKPIQEVFIKTLSLTQAQYDALVLADTVDPLTLYIIVDE